MQPQMIGILFLRISVPIDRFFDAGIPFLPIPDSLINPVTWYTAPGYSMRRSRAMFEP